MKNRFTLFRRGKVFYLEDREAIPDFNEPWDEFFPFNFAMSYYDAGGGNASFNGYLKIMHEGQTCR